MQRVIDRFIVVASVVAVAAGSAACARQDGNGSASSILGPTGLEARRGSGGKGGGGTTSGGGSLSYVMVIDKNSDDLPSFNDTVTFSVQTSATAYPWVTLTCYQSGTAVSQESNGIFPTSLDENFTLGPSSLWTGGAANCTATLESRDSKSITVLASTSFAVNAG